jgi:hypothetical protein
MFKSRAGSGGVRRIAEQKNRPQGFDDGQEYDPAGGHPLGQTQPGGAPLGRAEYRDAAKAAGMADAPVEDKSPVKGGR